MPHRGTRILPKSTPLQELGNGTSNGKRKASVRVACNACRTSKSACDGVRPQCNRCRRKATECVYISSRADQTPVEALKSQVESLRRKVNEYEEFIEKLAHLPEEDALQRLRSVRSSSNSSNTIRDLARKFELMVRHRLIYPPSTPKGAISVDLGQAIESIFSNKSPAVLNSAEFLPIYTQLSAFHAPQMVQRARLSAITPIPPPMLVYCDSRLSDLQIKYWTQVPVPDTYAASILSTYFQVDHAVLGFFDVDTFLTDLVERRQRFCSPFLVSSVMYMACLLYTKVDVRARDYKRAFLAEAEHRLEQERSVSSIVNVAAMTMLSLGYLCHGKNELGNNLLVESRQMAEQLSLFDLDPHENPAKIAAYQQMPPEWIKAAAHIAWGLYGCLSNHGLYFNDKPIRHPPILPIPGQDPTKREAIWPTHALPDYMGHSFPSMCKLWTIDQRVAVAFSDYKAESTSWDEFLAIAKVEYQEFLEDKNTFMEVDTS